MSPHFEDGGNGGRYPSDTDECEPMDPSKMGVVGLSGYAPWVYDEEKADRLWRVGVEREVWLKMNSDESSTS